MPFPFTSFFVRGYRASAGFAPRTFRYGTFLCQDGTHLFEAIPSLRIFSGLRLTRRGHQDAFTRCMLISLMLFTLQIAVSIFAVMREPGEDTRFQDDKLSYRS
jgi:hypothetical protein